MDNAIVRDLLASCRSIAIVGAKDRAGQPVDRVGRYLINRGFRVFPVHPVRENVWGLKTYRNLADIAEEVDVVDLFRAPEYCPEHARECLALHPRPRLFWMQLGIASQEARTVLAGSGVHVVENACLMVEHARFFPFASA